MAQAYASNSKKAVFWCDRCGTLLTGERCTCGTKPRSFEINAPGDIRPAIGDAKKNIEKLYENTFGTSSPLSKKAVFLNKIPGEDRADEIIAHGQVIGVLRFDIIEKKYILEAKLPSAYLFKDVATSNIVVFSSMSGHLKGKTIPGDKIVNIIGEFDQGDSLIIIKNEKIGVGIALTSSKNLKHVDKAIKIKDFGELISIPVSPDSGRKRFVECNRRHLLEIESKSISEISSYLKGRKEYVTVSFSGGKDSLAAYGIISRLKKPELIFANTGLEFPETIKYVESFALKNNLKLNIADAGNAFNDNVNTFGPPAKDYRWCCKVCKLGPLTELISSLYPEGTITIEGNRMLESFSRSKTPLASKNPFVPNQTTLNPVREWNASEIWGYIWMRGLDYNPLYEMDFERIGCYLCASCLSSEWENTKRIHLDLYEKWDSYLHDYAKDRGLPEEYVSLGFWRWKMLPPKMKAVADKLGIEIKPIVSKGPSMKVLKGASSCAAGGFSAEAIVTLPRNRNFSAVEETLKTIGLVNYSDEFEIALVKVDNGTIKLFGGGQVSVTSKTKEGSEILFERAVKALLRAQMCSSCGICVKKCHKKAIRLDDGIKIDEKLCVSCGNCEKSCMVAHYYDKIMSQ